MNLKKKKQLKNQLKQQPEKKAVKKSTWKKAVEKSTWKKSKCIWIKKALNHSRSESINCCQTKLIEPKNIHRHRKTKIDSSTKLIFNSFKYSLIFGKSEIKALTNCAFVIDEFSKINRRCKKFYFANNALTNNKTNKRNSLTHKYSKNLFFFFFFFFFIKYFLEIFEKTGSASACGP